MVVAIRIVLSLFPLWYLHEVSELCYVSWLGETPLGFPCVVKIFGFGLGIPLAVALVAGYWKKSKPVFWNVFVGTLFVMTIGLWIIGWIATL